VVFGEEVDVGGEGEGGGVVSEPDLDLLCVEAVAEEVGGAGVAEAVEAEPGELGFVGGWFEDALAEVAGVEVVAGFGGEDEVVGLVVCAVAPEALAEAVAEWDGAAAVVGFGGVEAAAVVAAFDLEAALAEVDV
jgi:hypothetical protein